MWAAALALLLIALATVSCWPTRPALIPPIAGIVWQPDNQTTDPRGVWQLMGAQELLVQWLAVDGIAFIDNTALSAAPILPAWQRIAAEPWARDVIVGLAGRFDEKAARADIVELARQSAALAKLPTPLHVTGWYFPVEIDPTWTEAAKLAPLLATLPRPLWISVYDSANVGPETLVEGLKRWLPADVGVFFQDGVGVYAREPAVARHYADVMAAALGTARVRLIAEAFRPKVGGGFRSASIAELKSQLVHYQGYRIYLFEGPRYVPDTRVAEIVAAQRQP